MLSRPDNEKFNPTKMSCYTILICLFSHMHYSCMARYSMHAYFGLGMSPKYSSSEAASFLFRSCNTISISLKEQSNLNQLAIKQLMHSIFII